MEAPSSKQQKLADDEIEEDEGSRNWANLPSRPLVTIIGLLLSVFDVSSFVSSIICSLRSLAPASTICRPPLLLNPKLDPLDRTIPPWELRSSWLQPPSCTIETLDMARSGRSMVPSETLAGNCAGYSHGHMIFVQGRTAVLADVFMGTQIVSPQFPRDSDHYFYRAILTAPTSSRGCVLVLIDLQGVIFWKLGTDRWISECKIDYSRKAKSAIARDGQVYFLNRSNYWVSVVDMKFDDKVSVKELKVKLPYPPFVVYGHFEQSLAKCGEEILLVMFVRGMPSTLALFKIYRLDLSKSMWVEMESLGDWCLFVDAMGSPIACPNPSRWGGTNNCVYVAGPGCTDWCVFPINDPTPRMERKGTPLEDILNEMPKWPSPVWVYPSVLY